MRKIGRQLQWKMFACTRSPPKTLPEKDDVPITVPNSPKAFALSCGGNVTCMIDSTWGNNSAPATPCTARARIRNGAVGARPHNIEAAVNAATPHVNIRLRPKMSPSLPPEINSTA